MNLLESAISKVQAAGTAGVCFDAFTQDEQDYLTAALVPSVGHQFAPTVRDLLQDYRLVVAGAAVATIDAHNASSPHKCVTHLLYDGTAVLNADLLTWCGIGDAFHDLQETLHQCPIRFINPSTDIILPNYA